MLSAWKDACSWSGGGGVLIPEGTYYMGPVHLRGECKGDMTFKIEGVVKASTDLSKFTTSSWIYFHHVNELTITGRGIIDGQGASAWSSNDCKSQPQHCNTLPVVSFDNDLLKFYPNIVDSVCMHINYSFYWFKSGWIFFYNEFITFI